MQQLLNHKVFGKMFFSGMSLVSLAQAEEFGSERRIRSLLPNPEAISGIYPLQPPVEFGPGTRYSPQQTPCTNGTVIPATPGQGTKMYHRDISIQFDTNKIDRRRTYGPALIVAGSIVMLREQMCSWPTADALGQNDNNPERCSVSKIGRYVLFSDLFICRQGQDFRYLRGYWENVAVMKRWPPNSPMLAPEEEHTITTSLGRGERSVPDPGGKFRQDMLGSTSEVKIGRFLFFSAASGSDNSLIAKTVGSWAGPKGPYEACRDGTFVPRGTSEVCKK